MGIKTVVSGVVLGIASVTGLLFISFPKPDREHTTAWSEPALLYVAPDTSYVSEFQADVHKGTIRVVTRPLRLTDDRYLDFSQIFLLQKEPGRNVKMQQLSSGAYPSEQPVMFRDHSDNVHFLWGERRQDPNFEEWEIPRPQVLGFSDAVVYTRYDGNTFKPPEAIYEGQLRKPPGIGSIGFPLGMTEDEHHRLHAVFGADSTFKTTTPEGDEVERFRPYVTYMSRNPTGEWSPRRFLAMGGDADIAALPGNRLAVAWLGSDPNQRSTNDVLSMTSGDGGRTWSNPQLVFLSSRQPGRMLRLIAAPGGRLHLVWGRQTRGLPVPNEIWHSISNDGGSTWREPERILVLEQTSNITDYYIASFDMISDSYGRIHWAGVVLKAYEGGAFEIPLLYSSWSPLQEQWTNFTRLEFAKKPGKIVSFALDKPENELFIFWDDKYETDRRALFYSKKPIKKPVSHPVIAQSGPLKLHANYPNPFNLSTVVPFTLETPGKVVLRVYNIAGRQVLQQNLGLTPAGAHKCEIDLAGMASGTYIYEIVVDGTWRLQKKMMFIK